MEARGFINVQGPYLSERPTRRWRAEFTPHNKPAGERGTGWGRTEKIAREKALRRALLKNRTHTTR